MSDCPNFLRHTEPPTNDYTGAFEWRQEMSKTFTVARCPDCLRFVIWTRRAIGGPT